MLKINTELGALAFSDNPQLETDISDLYNTILVKYGYKDIIDGELAKQKHNPQHNMQLVYQFDHELYHHVREQFLYNYGGVKRPTVCQTDELLNTLRSRNDSVVRSKWFDARVEFYTGIVVLFQEYGGIPKITNKY